MKNKDIYLNINNDPLLTNLDANSLIKENKLSKLFLDKNKKYINLYGALIKGNDFHVNTKNSFLKRTPYITNCRKQTLNYLKRLPDEYRNNNYKILRKVIANYYLSSRLDIEVFNRWIKNNRFPIVLYRILSKILKDEKILINCLKNKQITDVSNFGKVKLPFFSKDLFTPFNFYLAGIIMGDGNINQERIKITDGDKLKENLKESKEFLLKIRRKIRLQYGPNPSKPHLLKQNAYELIIANKWIGRYFNFIFSI